MSVQANSLDDDFVLTISDKDEVSVSDVDSDVPSAIAPSSNQKRKRTASGTGQTARHNKKQRTDQERDISSDVESSSDENLLQDETIDPDFEFDLGINIVSEDIGDFDGWADDTTATKPNGNKKGVDIDAIIARRAQRLGPGPVVSEEPAEADGEQEPVLDFEDIDDDDDQQLLAPDAFNSSTAFGQEEYPPTDEDAASDGGSESNPSSESDPDSDSDSVASPTAHPDDLESDHSDADPSSQTSDDNDDNEEEEAKRTAFFAPQSNSQSTVSVAASFQQFSLSRPILRALAALSFSSPTPIQSRAIPIALSGLDIVGSAVTGSGKTAAFLVPILERLLYRPRKVPTTRVVVLMPTRELAVQCHNVAVALARYTDITFALVVGGFSVREQEAILKKRPDVVIATPGRFIDHMRNSVSFAVENIEILVLDEADRMLEDGFADELDEILRTIPHGRQTMLFSATMTESIDKLVRVGMNKPVRVSVDAKRSTVSGLVQEFVRLRPGREQIRLATLAVLCTKVFTQRTIVFFRQKKEAHRVRIVFGLLGLKAGELHGSMSQEQRIAAVTAFRDGKTSYLLATDLASRGLDIKNVLSVVNYEAPQSHEIYLHRVGRTARAGRSGRACTIAAEPDRRVVKAAVKAARSQGAKIVSRTMVADEVDRMHVQIESYADEVEEILQEEKEEKALAQAETQIVRGENIVKHQDEIMSRPKRTWFESEKDKQTARERGKAELNRGSSAGANGVVFTGEKKKLSNKDKKRLDDRRDRTEGRTFKKKRGDADAAVLRTKSKTKGKGKAGGQAGGKTGGRAGGGGHPTRGTSRAARKPR